jgi:transposase-like protein
MAVCAYTKRASSAAGLHKTANILDKMPKSVQPAAKRQIHQMYLSPTREKAGAAYDRFLKDFQAKYPKACECLQKDKDVLFAFYDFPAEHWGAPAHDQSDRKHLCDRPAPHAPNQGLRFGRGHAGDGFQLVRVAEKH